ncbi:MAG: hypothetical protein CMK65_05425 [Pseudoalteromonas sp.]|nr:hypothetical protein [Pseudoalteromonas sp.]
MDAFASRVYFLRHGEIATPGILSGQVDVDLSEQGYRQMRQASAELKNLNAIYSSPLKRCSVHADYLANQHRLNVRYYNALKEFNFGDWDGQDYQQLWQ